ncbi:hypothetical protein FQR65_LT05139 [Abscondita terminalis]|nr:hypothetical protein FQR65_LT05139 [Abscondita terminalis]
MRLKQSTWINDLQQALLNFTELGSFQTWGKEFIRIVDDQLELLAKLEAQINHFNNNHIGLTKATTEIERSLSEYDALEAENKASLLEPFTDYALLYCKEKNAFFKELSEKKLPFVLASLALNDQNDFDDQFDFCIQLIKSHIKNPEKLLNFFDIIKHSYLNENEPNLSYFIFTAHEQAIQLLKNKIKKNFLELNLQQIKSECENPNLYTDLYQGCLILLANHYQAYSHKLTLIKNKLEFLDTHLGESVKDWLNEYKILSDTTFLSQANLETLLEKINHLSAFATQLSLNNDKEFLKKIKSKTQDFLNSKINNLEEQFQNSQTRITEFAKSSPLAKCISDKLKQIQKKHYIDLKEAWIKRKNRLKIITVVEEFKNFKDHFPKKNLFDSDSLNFKELHAIILLLKESNPALQTEIFIQDLANIPLENLTKNIFFILENLNDDTLLSSSVNNLLQFIHSENSKRTITAAKVHLAISLQAFFNRQPIKMALCIAHNAPLNTVLNTETYEKLITILRYTNSDKLEKCPNLHSSLRLKIKELSARNEIDQTIINQAIERLISTKKIIHLFEDKNTYTTSDSENNTFQYSLWDACCLFQQFEKKSFTSFPYLKELKEKTKVTDELFIFQFVVWELDKFITAIEKISSKSYQSTLFLKPGKEKQEYVNQLINQLKNIPIHQVDTSAINKIFEQWNKDHQHLIDEPRYRLLVKLCMLIYRQFIKIFFSELNCFTASHQNVNELQEQFLNAHEYLQKLRNNFTHSTHDATATATLPALTP